MTVSSSTGSSYAKIVSAWNTPSSFPIEKLSIGTIFEECHPKKIKRETPGMFILLGLHSPVFKPAAKKDQAALYFRLAYSYHRIGVNEPLLEEVLENADKGLASSPSPDVKIGLLFLKAISLIELSSEVVNIANGRAPSDKEEHLVAWAKADFTAVVADYQNCENVDEFTDLKAIINEIRERTWPAFPNSPLT